MARAEVTNPGSRIPSSLPTFNGKYLTSLDYDGGEDDFLVCGKFFYADNKLERIENGEAVYKISYNPFKITTEYEEDGWKYSESYSGTFGSNGLLEKYESTITTEVDGKKSVEYWSASHTYNDDDQIIKMVAKAKETLDGVVIDDLDGTAVLTYDGGILKSMVTNASGKEWDQDVEDLVNFTCVNTFTMVYDENAQVNKFYQFTPIDGSFFSAGGVQNVLTMLGLAGKFSGRIPKYMDMHYEYDYDGEKEVDDDRVTYDVEFNRDGTIHSACGYKYSYSDGTTRAEIAASKPAMHKGLSRLFRRQK